MLRWINSRLTNLSLEAVLFYLLVFATVVFSRDFARLHLRVSSNLPYLSVESIPSVSTSFASYSRHSGFSFYVTEIFLVLIVGIILVRRWRQKNFAIERTPVDFWLVLWVLVGLFELVRGTFTSGNILLALRDFGMNYYVIFFFLVNEICRNWRDLKRLVVVFLFGTILRIAITDWYYINNINFFPWLGMDCPSIGQFMSGISGAYILLALLFGMTLWKSLRGKKRWLFFSYLSLASFSLFLTQQRSLLLAFMVGIVVITIGARKFSTLKPLPFQWILSGTIIAGSLLWLVRISVVPSTPALFLAPARQLVTKLASTIESSGESSGELIGTARFRRDAWQEALQRFKSQPILGEGFGKKFTFYDTWHKRFSTNDFRPHNTYITILYKTGLTGLTSFIIIHIVFFKAIYQGFCRGLPLTSKTYLLGLTGGMIGFQFYGFFNLLLESPFLALIYWSLMGVIFSLIRFGTEELI